MIMFFYRGFVMEGFYSWGFCPRNIMSVYLFPDGLFSGRFFSDLSPRRLIILTNYDIYIWQHTAINCLSAQLH